MIAKVAMADESLTIVTTGPLTNVALALRKAIAPKLQRIVILCGAWGLGKKTVAAEWNVLCDRGAGDRLRLRRAGDACAH
jgi:inosine-uridine nucleoside N-ribohydrolase